MATCPNTTSLQSLISNERYVAYQVIAPIYFVLGLTGHSLLLLALYKQSKLQPAYMYQVFRAVSETVQVFTRSMYYFSSILLLSVYPDYQNPLPALNRSFTFVWYAAHLSIPISNAIVTTSLILSVCMVADRVFALWNPMRYQKLNRKWHQILAVILSVFVSFAACVFDCFRIEVIEGAEVGTYTIVFNTEYMNSRKAYALALCRAVLQGISLLALVVLSVCLTFLYRARFVKGSLLMSNAEQGQRKQAEKTLVLLTLLECTFNALGISFLIGNYVGLYGFPDVYVCAGKIVTPFLDMTLMAVDVADFYTMVLVSRRFRKMLRDAMRCNKTRVDVLK